MFAFDLISSLVECSITNKKKKLAKTVSLLLSCSHFESKPRRTPVQQGLMRLLFSDCTVPAVPQTRLNSARGTWDKTQGYLGQDAGTVVVLCLGPYLRYHYGFMETRLKIQNNKQRNYKKFYIIAENR